MDTKRKAVYCPFCRNPRPLWKAGTQITTTRQGGVMHHREKQRYQCNRCRRITVNPRKTKPRTAKK